MVYSCKYDTIFTSYFYTKRKEVFFMAFIKAFSGALGGAFADQWKDFYGPRGGVPSTAAIFQAVPQGTNAGR